MTERGIYSAYFLVPKKAGGFRPILDLQYLNRFIAIPHTIKELLELACLGDWLAIIDLRNTYSHIKEAPK